MMEYKTAPTKDLESFINWCNGTDNDESLICDLVFSLIEHHAKHALSVGTLKNMIFEGLENFDNNWFVAFIQIANLPIECEHVIDTWFDKYTEYKTHN